jgi:hypothetical protein
MEIHYTTQTNVSYREYRGGGGGGGGGGGVWGVGVEMRVATLSLPTFHLM